MGLFSMLQSPPQRATEGDAVVESKSSGTATTGTATVTSSTGTSPSSSSLSCLDLPTVVQLYRFKPLRLDWMTGAAPPPSYAILSYTAVSVSGIVQQLTTGDVGSGAVGLRANKQLLQQQQQQQQLTPEMGCWNCRIVQPNVRRSTTTASLQDAVLNTIPTSITSSSSSSKGHEHLPAFVLTVDLTTPSRVEPTLTLLQEALVRYLIEHKEKQLQQQQQPTHNIDPADPANTSAPTATSALTTSLYDLRSVPFGQAPNDEKAAASVTAAAPDESDRCVQIALLIVALWPDTPAAAAAAALKKSDPAAANDANSNNMEYDTYREKQSQQLLMYHLRRFANSLNCHLCFLNPQTNRGLRKNSSNINMSMSNHDHATDSHTLKHSFSTDSLAGTTEFSKESTFHGGADAGQPAVNLAQLAIICRELAQGRSPCLARPVELYGNSSASGVPEEGSAISSSTENGEPQSAAATNVSPYLFLYGPEHHTSELIESVLLRNAHYHGQWDASKDSLWKVFPPPTTDGETSSDSPQQAAMASNNDGDDEWLSELRDSIISPSQASEGLKTPAKPGTADGESDVGTKTPSENVSSFFENLLKT